MKSNTAYYLIILYTLAMCKPILPLIQDELAHLFWQAEHMATVHHHHGDHHAEEEIAEAAHEEENDKSPTTTKTSEPVSVHIVLQMLYAIPQIKAEKQKFKTTVSYFSTVFLDKHYPPPKYC